MLASGGIRENSESVRRRRPLNSHEFSYRWGLLLAGALMVALAGPFLAGRIYTADDLGAFHLPMRAFYADCLAHGEAFDWSPQMYCGFYLTGEGQIGGYHPLHWLLYRFLPLPVAFDLECLLPYPFMLVGMYLLLRRWEIRGDAALFGGLTFAFSGFSLLHFVHVNGIAVISHLPWLLLAVHEVICGSSHQRRLFGGVGLALLTGSQLLLGYPQYVWLSVLAEFGYVALAYRTALLSRPTVLDGSGAPSCGCAGRTVIDYCRAVGLWIALGVLLGAVQLLPTIDALFHSSRVNADADFAGWGSLQPLNVVQLIAPYLFQNRAVGQNTHELGLYAGSVTLILAVFSLVCSTANVQLRLLRRGATGLVVLGLLLAFGDFGPLGWFLARMPLLNSFRFPCRAIVLVHLGLAVLASIGLMSLQGAASDSESTRQRRLRVLRVVNAASFILAVIGPIVWPDHVAALPLVWTGPMLISVAVILVVLSQRKIRWALPALILLAAVDLGAYGLSYAVYPQSVKCDDYLASIPRPPVLPPRRLALDLLSPNQPGLHAGNQLLLLGYQRADGYAGLEPQRRLDYRELAALRVAGVDWIAPTVNLEGRGSTDWLSINGLPKARLLTQSLVTTDPAHDISRIPLESTALVEPPLELTAGVQGTAKIVADRPGDIRVVVDAPSRQLLVLAESFHAGWEATVDGQSLPVVRVNGDFMGCVVPAGQSEVRFAFRPASLRYGRWLSFLGLSLIVTATLRSRLPRRFSSESRGAQSR